MKLDIRPGVLLYRNERPVRETLGRPLNRLIAHKVLVQAVRPDGTVVLMGLAQRDGNGNFKRPPFGCEVYVHEDYLTDRYFAPFGSHNSTAT